MGGKFTLDNAVDGGEPEQDVVAPQIDVTSKASARPKKSSSPSESVSSHKEDGLLISEQAAIKSLLETPSVETAEDRDLHEILRKLLHTLSAEDRIVVQLLHIEQKSAAEIAAITGWNSTVIKVRAFRARQKLRKALECLGYPRSL